MHAALAGACAGAAVAVPLVAALRWEAREPGRPGSWALEWGAGVGLGALYGAWLHRLPGPAVVKGALLAVAAALLGQPRRAAVLAACAAGGALMAGLVHPLEVPR